MNARERFALFAGIAYAAERAADACGALREYQSLCETIERNEREHRAFGRRLVGPSATRGRFSVAIAVHLFVVRTIADAYGKNGHGWERQIRALSGLRDDYVKAAILVSRPEFREAFAQQLGEKPTRVHVRMRDAAELADYSALANGEI